MRCPFLVQQLWKTFLFVSRECLIILSKSKVYFLCKQEEKLHLMCVCVLCVYFFLLYNISCCFSVESNNFSYFHVFFLHAAAVEYIFQCAISFSHKFELVRLVKGLVMHERNVHTRKLQKFLLLSYFVEFYTK